MSAATFLRKEKTRKLAPSAQQVMQQEETAHLRHNSPPMSRERPRPPPRMVSPQHRLPMKDLLPKESRYQATVIGAVSIAPTISMPAPPRCRAWDTTWSMKESV